MILTKTVRRNEFGVREFPPNISELLVGRRVEIRDWYGEVRGTVLSVAISRTSGYPSTVELQSESGAHVPAFSLHSTREIEVL